MDENPYQAPEQENDDSGKRTLRTVIRVIALALLAVLIPFGLWMIFWFVFNMMFWDR